MTEPFASRSDDTGSPMVSVVIPTYRRPDRLKLTLAALEAQTLPADRFEVIVSDDGSGDGTYEQVQAYAGRSPLRITVLTGPNGGPAAARNRGIAVARGAWVAFTDDDCVPEKDWLESFATAAATGAFDGAGGFVQRYRDTLLGRYIDWSLMMMPPLRGDGTAVYLVTANALFRRTLLHDLGGFDPAFKAPGGEDPHLSYRARERGARLVYLPEARIRHMHRDTIGGIHRTWFQYGVGERVMDTLRGQDTNKGFLHLVRSEMGAVLRRIHGTVKLSHRPVYVFCELVRRWGFSRGYAHQAARGGSPS